MALNGEINNSCGWLVRCGRLLVLLLLLLIDYAPFHHVWRRRTLLLLFVKTTGEFLVLISHADTEQLICWNQFEELFSIFRNALHTKWVFFFSLAHIIRRSQSICFKFILINKTFIWKVIITTCDYNISSRIDFIWI